MNDTQAQALLVDAVKDYGIFFLSPDGIVGSWNSGAARILGYTRDEIVGSHFSRFYSEADIAARKPWRELETANLASKQKAPLISNRNLAITAAIFFTVH